MTGRPFQAPTALPDEQLAIMYRGLPTKGRLVRDAEELARIDAALAEDPDQYFLWCARAVLVGDADQAIASYSQALRLRPLASHSLYNRGRKLLGGSRVEMAAADLAASVAIDPDEPWKWHFYGVALHFLERQREAVRAFDRAADAAERAGEALLPFEVEWMWNCLMRVGDTGGATAALERVDASTPVLPSEATYKQRILLYRGLITEQEFLDGIDRNDPIEAANQLYGYANYLHYLRGDVDASIAVLHDAIATAPGGAGWGAKMAARDLPERLAIVATGADIPKRERNHA